MHSRYGNEVNHFCFNSDENSVLAHTAYPGVGGQKLNFSVQFSKAKLS